MLGVFSSQLKEQQYLERTPEVFLEWARTVLAGVTGPSVADLLGHFSTAFRQAFALLVVQEWKARKDLTTSLI